MILKGSHNQTQNETLFEFKQNLLTDLTLDSQELKICVPSYQER